MLPYTGLQRVGHNRATELVVEHCTSRSQARSQQAFPAFVPAAKGGSNNHQTLKGTEDRKGPAASPTARRACVSPSWGPGIHHPTRPYHLQASAPASCGVVRGEVVGVEESLGPGLPHPDCQQVPTPPWDSGSPISPLIWEGGR